MAIPANSVKLDQQNLPKPCLNAMAFLQKLSNNISWKGVRTKPIINAHNNNVAFKKLLA